MDFKEAFDDNMKALDGAIADLKSASREFVSNGFPDHNGNWVLRRDAELEKKLDQARKRADKARALLDGVVGSFARVNYDPVEEAVP